MATPRDPCSPLPLAVCTTEPLGGLCPRLNVTEQYEFAGRVREVLDTYLRCRLGPGPEHTRGHVPVVTVGGFAWWDLRGSG